MKMTFYLKLIHAKRLKHLLNKKNGEIVMAMLVTSNAYQD